MQTTQPITLKCAKVIIGIDVSMSFWYLWGHLDISSGFGLPIYHLDEGYIARVVLFALIVFWSRNDVIVRRAWPKKQEPDFCHSMSFLGYRGPGSPKTCYETSLAALTTSKYPGHPWPIRAPTAQSPTLRHFKLMGKGALLHIHMGFCFQLIDRGKHVLSSMSIMSTEQHVRWCPMMS